MQTALDSHELLHTLAGWEDICFLHQVCIRGRKEAGALSNKWLRESPASSIHHRLSFLQRMPQGCFYQSFSIKASHTHKHELLLLFFSLSTQGAFSPSLVAATYCAATYFSSRRRQEKARADIGRPLESSQCEILPAQATAEILQASVTTRSFWTKFANRFCSHFCRS